MLDDPYTDKPDPESEVSSTDEAAPQPDMFSGGGPSSVAEDIGGRRSVQLKSYKSLERLRDRVLLTSRELARLRTENQELKRQVEELKVGGGTVVEGTPIVLTESPAALRTKVEGFIEAIDQYLHEDLAGEIHGRDTLEG
ncbi:MAG: hypothetical protein ACI9W4_002152 [Rhodothermales bacterium]|jgi:hypothetical protein